MVGNQRLKSSDNDWQKRMECEWFQDGAIIGGIISAGFLFNRALYVADGIGVACSGENGERHGKIIVVKDAQMKI